MTQPNLLELAKQGNPKAIAALMNRQLQPKGITAKVALKDHYLQILLEAAKLPSKQACITFIQDGLNKLGITEIDKAKVYGKQIGEDFPEWHQEIILISSGSKTSSDSHGSASHEIDTVLSKDINSGVEADIEQISNQIYETLRASFNEPILNRLEEEDEKTIHEVAEDFLDDLEIDLRAVFSKLENKITTLVDTFNFELDRNKISALFFGISSSDFSGVNSAIKQLHKATQNLLETDFSEKDTLIEVGKGAFNNFIRGGGLIGAAIGGVNVFFDSDKQKQENQIILEKYEKAREKVYQEWESVRRVAYDMISQLILQAQNIQLTSYSILHQAEDLCKKSIEYLWNKNYKEAITSCDRAIELNPISAIAWNLKGYALYELNSYREAIQSFNKAIYIDRSYLEAWQNKGNALQKLGQHEEAILSYDHTIQISSHNYSAWLSKSQSLCELGRYDEAVKACDIAVTLDSENFEAWYTKATCAALIEDLDQVLTSLKNALNLNLKETQEKIQNDARFGCIRENDKFKALVEDSSVGIDFSELRKFLSEKDWKKADKETAKIMCEAARLSVLKFLEDADDADDLVKRMIEIDVSIEEDEPLSELHDSIIKFIPRTDLNTLDKLWIEHSNSKFGFSVQRKIYRQLGDEDTWDIRDKFGNQTGWRIRDKDGNYNWRRSDRFEYDFEKAPEGHLPSCLWAGKEDGWFSSNRRDRLVKLFAHMDDHSIANINV
ncbi:GUN4 domain-containing protein [Oscillatoria sp. FACHB-1407]|uniref:GUN4 domain-containing protein n=1 Tax=Oscillatoria sp. FACHB-1407 TaxID=2692847 RepID=UPI001684D2F5|nr:GUN4 domain-containing protein [Oscillatoria sp. FACHB-1407]MBD2460795.1 GUN4 domain-containing protein [Oscillatoria sp. FACHB-1407]